MRINTKRDRERDDNKWCIILREDTRTTKRLKTSVEPNWFGIMPCSSIYSVVMSTPEVSRMFQKERIYMNFL